MLDPSIRPTPWVATQNPSDFGWSVFDANGVCLAMNLDQATAHLISAAPELHIATKIAIEEIEIWRHNANNHGATINDTTFKEGRAALAKISPP